MGIESLLFVFRTYQLDFTWNQFWLFLEYQKLVFYQLYTWAIGLIFDEFIRVPETQCGSYRNLLTVWRSEKFAFIQKISSNQFFSAFFIKWKKKSKYYFHEIFFWKIVTVNFRNFRNSVKVTYLLKSWFDEIIFW